MENDVKRILISEEDIMKRIKELGEEITEDYKDKELIVVGILKGAVVFMAELCKNIKKPINMDFMSVSSYGQSAQSTGEVKIIKDLDSSVEGKDILIVEDIIDTGLTLSYLTDNLRKRGAKSVKIVTLLDKPNRKNVEVKVDYLGFEVPNEFIIGYGLDYAEMYRNLPYVASLKESVYSDGNVE